MAKNNTSFQPGNPGKPKGAQNKLNSEIRDKFKQLLDGITVEEMIQDLKALKPAERLNVITGLAEYVTPKLNRTDLKHEIEPVSLEDARVALLAKLSKGSN